MMCWIKIYGTNYTNLLDIRQDSCCKSLANKDRRGNPIVVQSMVHVDPSSVKKQCWAIFERNNRTSSCGFRASTSCLKLIRSINGKSNTLYTRRDK
ncbi:4-hydroxy-3-methylbut-2-enyl diphosphate synthase [Wolbachia endosymbiont of Onchocerca ochengi]|nr:4-hydroxy-3-methylbut-2-enyl diphosphate synthase [Wolbachia endosymbiont of Onchocerca ochengi]